jgi:hypothetical protein
MNRRWPPLLLVPTMLLLFAGLGAAVHRGSALQPPTCQQLQFHVALAPGLPARYKVVGWLCGRPPLSGRTVQILISGTTQTHVYWDFPLRSQQYSYVRALTQCRLCHAQSGPAGYWAERPPPRRSGHDRGPGLRGASDHPDAAYGPGADVLVGQGDSGRPLHGGNDRRCRGQPVCGCGWRHLHRLPPHLGPHSECALWLVLSGGVRPSVRRSPSAAWL